MARHWTASPRVYRIRVAGARALDWFAHLQRVCAQPRYEHEQWLRLGDAQRLGDVAFLPHRLPQPERWLILPSLLRR